MQLSVLKMATTWLVWIQGRDFTRICGYPRSSWGWRLLRRIKGVLNFARWYRNWSTSLNSVLLLSKHGSRCLRWKWPCTNHHEFIWYIGVSAVSFQRWSNTLSLLTKHKGEYLRLGINFPKELTIWYSWSLSMSGRRSANLDRKTWQAWWEQVGSLDRH